MCKIEEQEQKRGSWGQTLKTWTLENLLGGKGTEKGGRKGVPERPKENAKTMYPSKVHGS